MDCGNKKTTSTTLGTTDFHPVTETLIASLEVVDEGPWTTSERALDQLASGLSAIEGLELVRVLDQLEAMCRFLDRAASETLSDRILVIAKARADAAVESAAKRVPTMPSFGVSTWQRFSNPNPRK